MLPENIPKIDPSIPMASNPRFNLTFKMTEIT